MAVPGGWLEAKNDIHAFTTVSLCSQSRWGAARRPLHYLMSVPPRSGITYLAAWL
jgi:hypothetical protein